MKCPNCESNKLVEVKSWEPYYMGYGWSVKECVSCGFRVRDKTLDRRFVCVDEIICKGSNQ